MSHGQASTCAPRGRREQVPSTGNVLRDEAGRVITLDDIRQQLVSPSRPEALSGIRLAPKRVPASAVIDGSDPRSLHLWLGVRRGQELFRVDDSAGYVLIG